MSILQWFLATRRLGGWALLLAWALVSQRAGGQEFRALWVDAFHAGFRTSSEVSQLVADARAGNFNAVMVEVRKRGDAYYDSRFEPKAGDISPASFDPLADLLAKAHNTNPGPRLEVHAWIVTYPIWNTTNVNAAPANHPVRLHPDWLTKDSGGGTWNGANYVFDPGHPGVQQHTFNVAMDLIARYDVDGLNFDYVRYDGPTWGYNDVAVARFNARFGRAGLPASTDAEWKQFRRDQVTALVRKVYLSTLALKPHVKISADTITWAPGVTTTAQWPSTAAYAAVLQDWRAWMEEGILDLNLPMAYFNQAGQYAGAWTNWNTFTKDHRYGRHAAIGPGLYLNSLSNALVQMRFTRQPSPAGNFAEGVCGYSYAVPTSDGTPRATFLAALTSTNTSRLYETHPTPIFATRATPPVMPWKATPTRGHVKGLVQGGNPPKPLDGATVVLDGPSGRAGLSDATGFYGFVDLPPGNYTVSAWAACLGPLSSNFTVTAGTVATVDLPLPSSAGLPPSIFGVQALHLTDSSAAIVWSTDAVADSGVDYGLSTSYGMSSSNAALVTTHAVTLTNLTAGTTYHFRVRSRTACGSAAVSGDFTFQTNPAGVVNDLVVDNPQAVAVGSWSTGTSATDKFGADYRFKSQGNGSQFLQFTPQILVPGDYAVFAWHPQGGNRTTNAPHVITHAGGTETVFVNQEINGGRWNLLGTFPFVAGTSGSVQITDAIPEPGSSGNVVLADAVRWAFVPAPPRITTQPQDRTLPAGSAVVFSVIATGSPPLAYQWRFNGTNLAAATAASYTRGHLRLSDAGLYSVVVSNAAGATTSSNALLTVLAPAPPTLEAQPFLASQQLQLQLVGEPGCVYVLQRSSNLTVWTPWLTLTNITGLTARWDTLDSSRQFYRVVMP
jgi:uncharacterized lipoprotein YddW (UPF0748 family)